MTRHRRTAIAIVAALACFAAPATPALALPTLIPTIATSIRNTAGVTVTSVNVGSTVHAYVSVSGSGGVPSGTVTVLLWRTNGSCSGTASAQMTQGLVNGVADATYLTQSTDDASTASFRASYSGGGSYFPGVGPCRSVTFTQVSPTVTLKFKNASGTAVTTVPYGTSAHAFLTVTGTAGIATGIGGVGKFASTDCTGNSSVAASGTLVNGSLDTGFFFNATMPGTYWFNGYYKGDSSYLARSTCISLTVPKLTPTLTVKLLDRFNNPAPWTEYVGEDVHATASLSGALGVPSGTITVRRYPNGTCTGSPEYETTVPASGIVDPAGDVYGPYKPSTHSWRLTYSGDAKYVSKAGTCLPINWKGTTDVSMDLRTPSGTVVTTAPVGTDVHPRVSLTTIFGAPTGAIIVEWWYADVTCSNDGTSLGTRTLSNGGLDDPTLDLVLSKPGYYSFRASYVGDSAYFPTHSNCTSVLAKAIPDPTPQPTVAPTPKPTLAPTPKPTVAPTSAPTPGSTVAPATPAASSAGPTASADAGAGGAEPSASPAPAATDAAPAPTDEVAAAQSPAPGSTDAVVGGAGAESVPSASSADAGALPVWLPLGLFLLLLVALLVGVVLGRRRRARPMG